MRLVLGSELGHYRIISLLGAGGMGEVYRAEDIILRRQVAIKTLPEELVKDETALSRFETEARALAALSHPNILSIHEFGNQNGIVYAVEELLEGETLRERLTRAGALRWVEAVTIAAAIADGLAAAHSKSIVHRDLKPENVFLTSAGGVKILDFGIARVGTPLGPEEATRAVTTAGVIVGTLHYMSPEQLRGESVDATTDLFALGCVIYEMLTRQRLFARTSAADTITAIASPEPVRLASIPSDTPSELAQLLDRCLRKDRADRPQSARDLATTLRAFLTAPTRQETIPSLPPVAKKAPGFRSLIATVGAIAVIVIAVMAWRSFGHAAGGSSIHSIAVMPFEYGAGNGDVEYLSDGLTEGLINSLARLPTLRVVARTTSFAFKNKAFDPRKAGKELGVDALITGRVELHGNDMIVQAELVDVDTLSQLWGERYAEPSRDLIAIQETVARQIAQAVRPQLSAAQRQDIASAQTRNPAAYELYLRGRFEYNKRNAEAMRRAADLYRQAIDIDPQFALAYCGLADTYATGSEYGMMTSQEAASRGEPLVQRALQLAPGLAETHASLGLIEHRRWQWSDAVAEFRKAISLNPNYAMAHLWLALALNAIGSYDQEMAELRRAEAVDPLAPIIHANLSRLLASQGHFEEALASAQRALHITPDFSWGLYNEGFADIGLRRNDEAIAAFGKLSGIAGFQYIGEAGLAVAYAKSGNAEKAREIAGKVEEGAEHEAVAPTVVAVAYCGLDDREKIFAWLEKALATHDPSLPSWAGHFAFHELKSDPRYRAILNRLAAGSGS